MSVICASCGHLVDGRYCSRCGEERLEPGKLTVWHFVTRSLPAEIFDLDGKAWRTLRFLILRPGLLSVEYAAGRRRLYVKPLRVLLTAIVAYALIVPSGTSFTLGIPNTPIKFNVAPVRLQQGQSIDGTLYRIDRFGILRRMYEHKWGAAETASDEVTKRFSGRLGAVATPLSFTTVLLLAFPLYACFHRRRPLVVEHAVFSMHYFSLVLLSTLVLATAAKAGLRDLGFAVFGPVMLSVLLWQFVYLAVALRRFYLGESRKLVAWPIAAALAALLYVLNGFFITAVQFVACAVAIWTL